MNAIKEEATRDRYQIPRTSFAEIPRKGIAVMACAITKAPSKKSKIEQLEFRDQSDRLDEWLLRSHKTLNYIARLILGSSELAAVAVERSRVRAFEDSPSFEREGPFRSWIFRVLIDEASAIVHRHHPGASKEVEVPDNHDPS